MVKLQNLIGRKSVPPFQMQPFADVFQSMRSKKLQKKFTGIVGVT